MLLFGGTLHIGLSAFFVWIFTHYIEVWPQFWFQYEFIFVVYFWHFNPLFQGFNFINLFEEPRWGLSSQLATILVKLLLSWNQGSFLTIIWRFRRVCRHFVFKILFFIEESKTSKANYGGATTIAVYQLCGPYHYWDFIILHT